MGVEVVADRHRAAFVCNTTGISFGPSVSVVRRGERSHRELAYYVIERAEDDLRALWDSDPDRLRSLVVEAKLQLFPEVYDEDDFGRERLPDA